MYSLQYFATLTGQSKKTYTAPLNLKMQRCLVEETLQYFCDSKMVHFQLFLESRRPQGWTWMCTVYKAFQTRSILWQTRLSV